MDADDDGTCKPLNNITRAEAVKIVNPYLNRGVDDWGLTNAAERVWDDVPESCWAYYEIIGAVFLVFHGRIQYNGGGKGVRP